MVKNSKIGWTDHTFNHVIGCSKISPGCKNCFAWRDFDLRYKRAKWGDHGTRVLTSEAYWKQPPKWNGICRAERKLWEIIEETPGISTHKIAQIVKDENVKDGWLLPMARRGVIAENETGWVAKRWFNQRVFCASLSDVFENWQGVIVNNRGEAYSRNRFDEGCWFCDREPSIDEHHVTMDDVRKRLFELIDSTPYLDYLILTKRPENILDMWPSCWEPHPMPNYRGQFHGVRSDYRSNVWLGCSVENQEYADKRIPELLKCRDLSPVLFLSCEPLLGDVRLDRVAVPEGSDLLRRAWDVDSSKFNCLTNDEDNFHQSNAKINWVIVGSESGPDKRETKTEWFETLMHQCKIANVPFFLKQMEVNGKLKSDKDCFPDHLQVHQYPGDL